jgi:hypothetical protein
MGGNNKQKCIWCGKIYMRMVNEQPFNDYFCSGKCYENYYNYDIDWY